MEPPERTDFSCLLGGNSMQSEDQFSSDHFSPLSIRNAVQHLLASPSFIYLGLTSLSTNTSLIFIGFLGGLLLQFSPSNLSLKYFTRQRYS